MIELAEYDARWAAQFRRLHDLIWPRIARLAVSIEHVGSTSVPGLAAKPVIDVDIVIESAAVFPGIRDELAQLGYTHRGDLGIAGREAFACRQSTIRHHLYVCVQGNLALRNHLALRDHLRQHPADAEAYSRLKRDLAARFPDDMDSYIEGKTGFILAILAKQGITGGENDSIRSANSRAPRSGPQLTAKPGRV